MMTLDEVAAELSRRLARPFLRDADRPRPVHGDDMRFRDDPHWRDLILFHEYFHGDNGRGVGASHQTGWTGLVAKLLQQSGERVEKAHAEEQDLDSRNRLRRRKEIMHESPGCLPWQSPTRSISTELEKPSVSEIPNGRGVLVRVLRVGVDGTDKEINAAEYGTAPEGYDFLVTGHEGFGQVEAVGPASPSSSQATSSSRPCGGRARASTTRSAHRT